MKTATLAFLLLLFPCGAAFAEDDGDDPPKPAAEDEDDGARPGGRRGRGGPGGPGGRGGMGGGNRWERMSRMDADGDGKISADEFRGPPEFFERMDGDGDGYVTKDEVEAMPGRGGRGGMEPGGPPGMGGMGRSRGLGPQQLDTDNNGKISKDEYDAFFEKADENEDGLIDREEFAAATSGRALRDPAPKVGDPAPAVEAAALKDKRIVKLGAPERTTVLIFGSHT